MPRPLPHHRQAPPSTAKLLSLVFLGILVVPGGPAARLVLGIHVDPRVPLGPRLPFSHQSLGAPSPHSHLSMEAGSSREFKVVAKNGTSIIKQQITSFCTLAKPHFKRKNMQLYLQPELNLNSTLFS